MQFFVLNIQETMPLFTDQSAEQAMFLHSDFGSVGKSRGFKTRGPEDAFAGLFTLEAS